jgi:hypothetical protein
MRVRVVVVVYERRRGPPEVVSARQNERNKKRIVTFAAGVDDDWKKVIENFHRHRREKTTNTSTGFREKKKKENTLHEKENRNDAYSHRHLDSPGRLAADFHVEKDNWVRHNILNESFSSSRVRLLCRKVKALSKTKKERYFPLFVVSLIRTC